MPSFNIVTAPARRRKRIASPRRQQINANLSLISRTWPTLTDAQRQSFTDLAQTWQPNGKVINGMMAFQSLNGCRLCCGASDLLLEAPPRPDFIGSLSDYRLSAARLMPPALALTGDPSAAPGFRLLVQAAPFSGPLAVLATRPLSSGVTQAAQRQFVQIATLPGLLSEYDAASVYMETYPAPMVGMKVSVQLVPVTDNGFRGNPFTEIVTVTAAP